MKIFKVQGHVNKYGKLNISKSDVKHFINNAYKKRWFIEDYKLKSLWFEYSFTTIKKYYDKHPDIYSSGGIIYINKKLMSIFDKFNENIEYLPVTANGKRFYAVNILKSIDALDYDKSEFTLNSKGEPLFINKYFFNKNKVKNNNLFKLKFDGQIFCSEKFVNQVEKNGIIGFDFEEVWDSEVDITETSSNHGETHSEEYTFEQVLSVINEDNKAIFVSDEHVFKLDEDGLPVSGILYKHRDYQWKELAYLPPVFYNMKWKRLKGNI